jgi:hypothetical protein
LHLQSAVTGLSAWIKQVVVINNMIAMSFIQQR